MGNMYRFNNTDTSPASIPSKYQRVVIITQEKKGFSSQAKRFPSQDCLNESPGPGSYDCVSSAEVKSPSFSKKGTTGFVPSKAARPSNNPHRSSPGPNAYNLQSSFVDKHDFNIGSSRVFRLPVALQLDGPKYETPAPNQYDVSCGSTPKRFSSVVGTSAFLSKTSRNSFYPNNNVPSPCHYEVRNSVIQHDTKAIVSPFKSKTQRIPPPVDHRVPGPGAYSPHQTPSPEKKTIQPKGYFLAISAPPLNVPKFPPLPGPWKYYIRSYNCPPKHPIPTAAFASRAKRISQRSWAA
ncbi:O(6)-methylguanine-induced apoptosis 2 isoform X2 [Sparus aurata]|uniref:Sperm-tail PG-rich repeat containing 1 n=1 Tax=Sparus aurata TaxID=8175 RepID=A0A671U7V7_SPAAU|nr:O(6)-methylguanine-induced apoptosis 2 isoform X2 [Sparus aurata]